MKNRVAKLVAIGKVEIFEEEIPKLQSSEMLVQIKAAGICGSDRHYFLHGGLGSFAQPLPMYIGHEAAGIVADANGSKIFKVGDKVALEPARHCGECDLCISKKFNLCPNSKFMGANAPGAFSDYVVIREDQAEKMPDSMSFEMGALIEPLGVAMHALKLNWPKITDSATIFGGGAIGLCVLFMLKEIGLKQIYMVDRLEYKAKFAEKFGATKAFTLDDKYIEDIKKLTGNKGTTINIDAAGKELSINGCIQTASIGGRVLLIGIPETDYVPFNPHKMRIKELVLQNVRRSNQTLTECIKMVNEDDSLLKLVTHKFPLEKIQNAMEIVASYKDGVIKCMSVYNP